MTKKTKITNNSNDQLMRTTETEEFIMNKNLHIKVNGFDIYLGIARNEKTKQRTLKNAYKNQLLRQSQERSSFKQEYEMARLY